jgi:alpha-beta hydrolase superfamily lysophospholipase
MIGLSLKTRDNQEIAADFYNRPLPQPKGWIVYLHMMPATKESWRELAEKLESLGYVGLAIDFRGHGRSTGGPLGYQKFSDTEHQRKINDLEAAILYLKNQGAAEEKIILIGASIGANLALWWLADHPAFKTAILLSAGLNYRQIKTEPLAQKLQPSQKILFLTSQDDERSGGNNARENEALFAAISQNVSKKIIIYQRAGHGTEIINFIENA